MTYSPKSIIEEIQNTFTYCGIKRVSKTDVLKDAYLPNGAQREVLKCAGIKPGRKDLGNKTIIDLHVLMSDKKLRASYYESIRKGSGRNPEHRMGIFITHFEEGDELLLATDGTKVFIYQVKNKDKEPEDVTFDSKTQKIHKQLSPAYLFNKAKSAKRMPQKKLTTTSTYERSSAIVAYVQKRSGFKCEVDQCGYKGFTKEEGSKYIEVHHLKQLSDGGEDSINNAVAVCPNCHRKLHYGKGREKLKESLQKKVLTANGTFEKISITPAK